METWLQVRSFDAEMTVGEYGDLPKNPLYIVLDNLRSAFNVGAIFRLCDGMRVSGLFLCGYTAFPPHVKLAKTSMGTMEYVPWKRFETAGEAVDHLHRNGVEVWAAETTSGSCDYRAVTYPEKLGIVFGNEALGIGRDVLEKCDRMVEIPLYGFKNSLNVAACCAVIGFKALETIGGEKKATANRRR